MLRRLNYINLVPEEILTYNIFSRLPIKSLGLCKCVSKPWNSLISDPHFIKTLLTKTSNDDDNTNLILISSEPTPGFLYSVHSDGPVAKLNFDCSKTWSRVWGSCDGLILAEDNRTRTSMYLLNPTTLESKKLPSLLRPGCENICLFGFGYDSSCDDYAVVAISYRRYGLKKDACVYVYMLKTNKWNKFGPSPYDHRLNSPVAGIFVGGSLYWLAKSVNDSSLLVSAFNIANKEFSQLPVPNGVFDSSVTHWRLGLLKGCLCLINNILSELWVMKEYGVVESWIKLSIDISEIHSDVPLHLQQYNYNKVIGSQSNFKAGMTYVVSLVSPNNKDDNQTKNRGRRSKTIK